MRDAFGASAYIKFMLVFFAVFASMLGVALNYAKAYRVKNTVISYIEANNGWSPALNEKINNYVAEMNYYVSNINPGSSVSTDFREFCSGRGICIKKLDFSGTERGSKVHQNRGFYYRVTTFKIGRAHV